MRNERRYYNKKKIRSSQKRQCLGCWFFLWAFLFLKFRKIIAYILKSKLLEE